MKPETREQEEANRASASAQRRGEASTTALVGLREALAQGQLRGGDPVLEEEWANRLGVSRTPIRAAVGVLAAEGLLVKRGRQVYVFQPSLSDLIEVYEIRKALEKLAASICAQAPPEDALAIAAESFASMSDAAGTADWFTAHERFHMAIFGGSGRSRLVTMIRGLRMQSEPYVRYAIHADPHFRAESMNGHRRMMMALKRHDPVAMNALVDEHLSGTLSELDRLLALANGHDLMPLAFPPARTTRQ